MIYYGENENFNNRVSFWLWSPNSVEPVALCLGALIRRFFSHREGLIRVAFQSLQLVVTDFLPLMPCTCIKVVVDVAGKFGLQPQELNISLTAIGLLVGYRAERRV